MKKEEDKAMTPKEARDQFVEQLVTVRINSAEVQKQFLANIYNSTPYMHLMSPDDVKWVAPLAFEPFLPAVDILFECMRRKLRFFDEKFVDDDTNEPVVVERCEIIENETTFIPDEALEKKIGEQIMSILPTLDNAELNEYYEVLMPREYRAKIQDELLKRGDKKALLRLAWDYRGGDEASGIFIDFDKAKQIYDKLGMNNDDCDEEDFDPVKEADELRKDAIESFPEFATFVVEGPSAQAVKQLIESFYDLYAEKGEMYFYIPLELMMKALVDSKHYVGYIQTLTEHSPSKIEFTAEFYSCSPYSLKYALQQSFEDLKVDFVLTD